MVCPQGQFIMSPAAFVPSSTFSATPELACTTSMQQSVGGSARDDQDRVQNNLWTGIGPMQQLLAEEAARGRPTGP